MILVALFAGAAVFDVAFAAPPSTTSPAARPARKAATPAKRRPPQPRVQTITLRYTDLSSLPRMARSEFHDAPSTSATETAEDAEARCARAMPDNAGGVPPCLGLSRRPEPRSPVTFSFDLALKSFAAPKDIFVGQCPAGSSNVTCNNAFAEARAEQERLANTLDRQRRSPVGTFGIGVNF